MVLNKNFLIVLQDFLLLEEKAGEKEEGSKNEAGGEVVLKEVTARWEDGADQATLEKISLQVRLPVALPVAIHHDCLQCLFKLGRSRRTVSSRRACWIWQKLSAAGRLSDLS